MEEEKKLSNESENGLENSKNFQKENTEEHKEPEIDGHVEADLASRKEIHDESNGQKQYDGFPPRQSKPKKNHHWNQKVIEHALKQG